MEKAGAAINVKAELLEKTIPALDEARVSLLNLVASIDRASLELSATVNFNSERLSYGPRELAKVLGISRASVYKLIKAEHLPALKLGRRTLVRRAEVEKLLDRLESGELVILS